MRMTPLIRIKARRGIEFPGYRQSSIGNGRETPRPIHRTVSVLVLAALLIVGCTTAPPTELPTPEPTPTRTPRPTSTPVPQPVLSPDAFWVAADGRSTSVQEVRPNSETRTIPLPLNEG